MSTTITIHVQGNVLSDDAAVRRLVDALRELGQQHDIHVEWVGRVGRATLTRRTWQPRTYQRRQHPATFAGPDKRTALFGGRRAMDASTNRRGSQPRRVYTYSGTYYGGLRRSAWRGGRRRADVHRDRRVPGIARRGSVYQLFWLHRCAKVTGVFLHMRSRFCPDCGLERTTVHDRRTGAAERRCIK